MISQEAINNAVIDDGRHYELFCQWQDGKITEAEFNRRESEILDEIVGKLKIINCNKCKPADCPQLVKV